MREKRDLMKIFGYEAEFQATSHEGSPDLGDLLDEMHDSFTSNEHIYSADIVQEGDDRVTFLLGVRVTDSQNGDDATTLAEAATRTAFEAAGLPVPLMPAVSRASVRELVVA